MFTRSTFSDNLETSTSTTPNVQPLNSGFFDTTSREDGAGISCPSSISHSSQPEMASFALSNASSNVSPAEKHPGRSGTITPKACVSSPGSIAIGYFTVFSELGMRGRLVNVPAFYNSLEFDARFSLDCLYQSFRKVFFRMRYAHWSLKSLFTEIMMASGNSNEDPAFCLKLVDCIGAIHD